MSAKKPKSPEKKQQVPRKPALKGPRYEIVSCAICGAMIYKRHQAAHIAEFHNEKDSHPPKPPSQGGIKGVDLSELSPQTRAEISDQYMIDESGFLVRKDTLTTDKD